MTSVSAFASSPTRPRFEAAIDGVAIAVALLGHASLLLVDAAALARPSRDERPPLAFVDVAAPPAPRPPSPPSPSSPPPAESNTRPPMRARPSASRAAEPAAPVPTEATPAASEPAPEPLDLGGVLVSDVGGVEFGSGRASGAGIGSSPGASHSAATSAATGRSERVARGPEDLSVDVRPPEGLDALLEANYPSRARAQGLVGSARVRMRIDADGRVSSAIVLDEAPAGAGFGAACLRTLLAGPRWTAARDVGGTPIARVGRSFRCRFELR